ncbi:MAG: N(4)-(beta-N-acetylglucosaminyl)-L-asparaginase [Verrucomicrobium sp.]|nr:N(4)-(beta-N-acetylglucosaminyl)-L-asparaginase [Verrucomicrobium sp.]
MKIPRRAFLGSSLAAMSAAPLAAANPKPGKGGSGKRGRREPDPSSRPPVVISTWPFGKPANDRTLEVFRSGKGGLDAVEQGVRQAEADLSNPSVGLGGIPAAHGIVQLDACIMSGPGHRAGSVAAVEGFKHPVSIARRVMEETRHVMLVGEGAQRFARDRKFEEGPAVTPGQKAAWEAWKKAQEAEKAKVPNHDTIALLMLTPSGDLFGACSTSGWGYKIPGRVGDSPIIGGGLYVDNTVGAAGATGIGENVMRYCGSFLVVEFMRQGMSPTEACLATLHRIASLDPKGYDLSVNFIALDKRGRYGAAGTGQGFQYAVACDDFSKVLQSPGVTQKPVGPLGGNRL